MAASNETHTAPVRQIFWLRRAIHRPMPVSGETFDELSAPLVHIRVSPKSRQRGHQSIRISPEIHMDQWLLNLSESSGLHQYRSIECSSLFLGGGKPQNAANQFFCETRQARQFCAKCPKRGPSSPYLSDFAFPLQPVVSLRTAAQVFKKPRACEGQPLQPLSGSGEVAKKLSQESFREIKPRNGSDSEKETKKIHRSPRAS